MSDNENLESKYGRRKSVTPQSDNTQNSQQQSQSDDVSRFSRRSSSQSQYSNNSAQQQFRQYQQNQQVQQQTQQSNQQESANKAEQQRVQNIRRNIAETLSQYNSNQYNNDSSQYSNVSQSYSNANIAVNQESKFVKVLKAIIMFLIVAIVLCIVVAILMKPKINMEGGEIIDQINNAESMYYTMYGKYYYFSKTSYDSTLGIDMSIYKYFDSYEVLHNDETGNYEIKIYGATNAFTIVYYTLKSYLNK